MRGIKIQKGEIKDFSGTAIDGTIKFSSLTRFQAQAKSRQYSIKYVLHGREEYRIDGVRRSVTSGQFLLVRPHQEVEALIVDGEYTEGICIYLPPALLHRKGLSSKMDDFLFPEFPIDSNYLGVKHFFKNLSTVDGPLNTDQALHNTLNFFTSYLLRNAENLKLTKAEKASTRLHLWEQLEGARKFMCDHLDQKLRLKEIAAAAYLSPFYFQRLFKGFYKVSPANYLLSLRMQKAVSLLKDSQSPIEEIANQCGFDDVKYFKKCMKKFFKA